MRYHLDELLDAEDLTWLTDEAMAAPMNNRRRISWKWLGTTAACVALILCLANYQALAAGGKAGCGLFLRRRGSGNGDGSPHPGR